jgi:hypothetical protein
MEIDDELKQSIARLAEESDVPVQMRALDAAIAGIPLIGGSISALLTTEGKRRLVERILELADAISKRVTEVEAATLDKEYFKSEEFQTLFALAWEQLRTTHDKRKMKQLASALVTSGTTDFKDDARKELFLRVLRDLSPGHISILTGLLPSERRWQIRPAVTDPFGERLSMLQQLSASGLCDEVFEPTPMPSIHRFISASSTSQLENELRSYFSKPFARSFRISEFGRDFLRFLGESPGHIEEKASRMSEP